MLYSFVGDVFSCFCQDPQPGRDQDPPPCLLPQSEWEYHHLQLPQRRKECATPGQGAFTFLSGLEEEEENSIPWLALEWVYFANQ